MMKNIKDNDNETLNDIDGKVLSIGNLVLAHTHGELIKGIIVKDNDYTISIEDGNGLILEWSKRYLFIKIFRLKVRGER